METTVLIDNDQIVNLRQLHNRPDNQDTIIASMIVNKSHPCYRTWPLEYAQNISVSMHKPTV